MLITLIRRELLDNLMTFRFAAAVFIMLLLVVANTVVLLKDYEQRLTAYNTATEESHRDLREEKSLLLLLWKISRPSSSEPVEYFQSRIG